MEFREPWEMRNFQRPISQARGKNSKIRLIQFCVLAQGSKWDPSHQDCSKIVGGDRFLRFWLPCSQCWIPRSHGIQILSKNYSFGVSGILKILCRLHKRFKSYSTFSRRQTHRQTDRQTDRQTHRHSCIPYTYVREFFYPFNFSTISLTTWAHFVRSLRSWRIIIIIIIIK
jgi:hypothetical protein